MVMGIDTTAGPMCAFCVAGAQADLTHVERARPPARSDDAARTFDSPERRPVRRGSPGIASVEVLPVIPSGSTGTDQRGRGRHPDAFELPTANQIGFVWDGELGYGLTQRSVGS
jgi:hypothetical protein